MPGSEKSVRLVRGSDKNGFSGDMIELAVVRCSDSRQQSSSRTQTGFSESERKKELESNMTIYSTDCEMTTMLFSRLEAVARG